jgi:MFS family permease
MTLSQSIAADVARSRPARISRAGVAGAIAGNVLEFYDFVTYTFFAVAIGEQFFPSKDPFVSLMLSVATFGVGFVTRPIGGLVIGAYADRAGRKPAMMLTVALMAAGMLLVALTPPYATIGLVAPVLVVLARLVQGFALGGEVGPATAFLLEAAPADRRGFYGSWQIASQGLAAVIAGGVGLALTVGLPKEAMDAWGWRVPFLVGMLIVPVAIYMRVQLPETLDLEAPTTHDSIGAVFASLLTEHLRPVLLALALISSGTVATYIMTYMTTYATTTLKLGPSVSIAATLVFGLFTFVFALVGGRLSDRFGRKPLLIVPRVLFALVAYPAYYLVNAYKSGLVLLTVTAALALLGSLGAGVSLAIIPESLPGSVRSAGLAAAYAVAVTLFGGTAQIVVTWLIHATGDPLSPAWYLIVSSLVGLAAVLMMTETNGVALKD